jgi:hypothetical protein
MLVVAHRLEQVLEQQVARVACIHRETIRRVLKVPVRLMELVVQLVDTEVSATFSILFYNLLI